MFENASCVTFEPDVAINLPSLIYENRIKRSKIFIYFRWMCMSIQVIFEPNFCTCTLDTFLRLFSFLFLLSLFISFLFFTVLTCMNYGKSPWIC